MTALFNGKQMGNLNPPIWYQNAWKDLGLHEDPDNTGPVVREFIAQAKCGQEHDPWCAIFVNAKLETSGIEGTRSPSSQSFVHSPLFIQLPEPSLGCLVVFWRISKNSGLGHVGFYSGENETQIMVLGGNEDDAVRNELLPRNSENFGLVGYYWPAGQPIIYTGPIILSPDTPTETPTAQESQKVV